MVMDGTQTKDGVTPNPEQAQTPKVTPTYSQEQVDKMLRDAQTAVKADIGRLKAESDKAFIAAKAANERLLKLQREQDDRELESVKENPTALTAIQERQKRRQKETELAEVQERLNEANASLQEFSTKDAETTRERATREIAERIKVNPAKLADLAKRTNASMEAIEAIANEMPKVNANPNPPRNNFRPDSSEAIGGTPQSATQVQQDYIQGKINAVQYSEKMKALGKKP